MQTAPCNSTASTVKCQPFFLMWGFPRLGVPLVGDHHKDHRIIVFRGLYWGPPISGNYPVFSSFLWPVGPCK